jgi:hypothetical protein
LWISREKCGEKDTTKKRDKVGHELIKWTTPNGNQSCDMCKSKQPEGSLMFGCDSCDWDLCASCEFD